MRDPFSKYHPLTNFIFFIGAIALGVALQHPAYLLSGIFCAGLYYFLLGGAAALKNIALMLPFAFLIAAVNPLFNTMGNTVLFYLFNRPYTLQALLYGAVVGALFLIMMLWLGCYNRVMTSDKFTALFGNLIPSVSLLLVMVFRMVPSLVKKTGQIINCRRSIGKGVGENDGLKEKLSGGMSVISALASFALEGGLVTADSMRSRGYGSAKRQSFMLFSYSLRDKLLIPLMLLLLGVCIFAVFSGQAEAVFIPDITVAPISFGLVFYNAYLLIPTVLYFEEAVKWRIFRSKI